MSDPKIEQALNKFIIFFLFPYKNYSVVEILAYDYA